MASHELRRPNRSNPGQHHRRAGRRAGLDDDAGTGLGLTQRVDAAEHTQICADGVWPNFLDPPIYICI